MPVARPKGHRRRDDSSITSGAVYTPRRVEHIIQPLPSLRSVVRSSLSEIEDQRFFQPDRLDYSPRSLARPVRRLVAPKAPRRQPARSAGRLLKAAQLAFRFPKFVIVCVRRKARREVMHAIGKAGAGGRSRRKPRRNSYSSVRC